MEAYKNDHSQIIFETENEKHSLSKFVVSFDRECLIKLINTFNENISEIW